MLEIKINEDQNLERIDKILSEVLDYSRSKVQAMIKENTILVNDNPVKANYKVKTNDLVNFNIDLEV